MLKKVAENIIDSHMGREISVAVRILAILAVNASLILGQEMYDEGLSNPILQQLQGQTSEQVGRGLMGSQAYPEGEVEIPEYSPGASLAGVDYILGPGDQLVIYIKSLQERSHRITVTPEGKVFLPMIGELSVNRMTIQQLQAALTLEYSRYLKDFQISVALVRLRQITAQVLGQVNRPGVYQFNSLDRVSTALGRAGGTTQQASIRTVQLLRGGEIKATLDLYRYFRENDQSQNPRLEFGDIIFVPISSNFVRITGQVTNPGRYEIKEGERLLDLIYMAGGVTPRVTNEAIKIVNIAKPDKVSVIDIKSLMLYQAESANVTLRAGDIVTIPSAPTTVTVVGQVQKPGTFAFEPGTSVSYYLGLAGGYGERANPRNIKINRWGGKSYRAKEDTEVEAGDVIVVGGLEIKGWRDYIQVSMQAATLFFVIWQIAK